MKANNIPTEYRFYYIRNENNHPFGCVCTMRDGNNKFFRGISICNHSKGDNFSKKAARGISYSRAVKAMNLSKNDLFGTINSATDNIEMIPVSKALKNKFKFIHDKYGIGVLDPIDKSVMFIPRLEANIELTEGEKEMWKDFFTSL